MCPSQAILASGGRCLLCCTKDGPTEELEEGAGELAEQQECCNCTETRGKTEEELSHNDSHHKDSGLWVLSLSLLPKPDP